ncbi:hypothetical protein DVJ78_14575 [Humibacter sp. BT305]|nr:hypothetical protein DVJ78_14575 [Humibacter sp. BT305]
MGRPATFPFTPTSATQLRIGDVITVSRSDGRWGCLQVTDLKDSGTGSRTNLVVGVLPWVGDSLPDMAELAGVKVIQQGLTGIRIFTEGGARVIGWFEPVPTGLPSSFRDFGVGRSTQVWGWRAALGRSEALVPG